ncbi:hypothetical protein MUK42_14214 [Musa troglodytarum]|uniref:Uncharacterized protein n=1 Tax=Musa troglodytarum TaxID=320322 RepID=A0A9E7LCK9_9LILI|nr:hypothetical protein MUK42_14214 [Musa troglodytarum]
MMRRHFACRPPKRVSSCLLHQAAHPRRGRRGGCCSASRSFGRDRSRWLHEKGSCSERRGVLASQLIDVFISSAAVVLWYVFMFLYVVALRSCWHCFMEK